MLKIYCDMDGVLSDFEQGVWQALGGREPRDDKEMWDIVNRTFDFWYRLPPIQDGLHLFSWLTKHHPYVIILSSPGTYDVENISRQKVRWVREVLGARANILLRYQKSDFADRNSLLIDDSSKNILSWTQNDGHGILHKDGHATIKELKERFAIGTQRE